MSRRLAREAAMCLLYEREIQKVKTENTLAEMDDVLKTSKILDKQGEYIDSIMNSFEEYHELIDDIVERYSIGWSLERISKVDLSILRLSVIELCCLCDIPGKVSVNEAVELAKKYSEDKSPVFINGILASVIEHLEENRAAFKKEPADTAEVPEDSLEGLLSLDE